MDGGNPRHLCRSALRLHYRTETMSLPPCFGVSSPWPLGISVRQYIMEGTRYPCHQARKEEEGIRISVPIQDHATNDLSTSLKPLPLEGAIPANNAHPTHQFYNTAGLREALIIQTVATAC